VKIASFILFQNLGKFFKKLGMFAIGLVLHGAEYPSPSRRKWPETVRSWFQNETHRAKAEQPKAAASRRLQLI
jgi:hypothetical protein